MKIQESRKSRILFIFIASVWYWGGAGTAIGFSYLEFLNVNLEQFSREGLQILHV